MTSHSRILHPNGRDQQQLAQLAFMRACEQPSFQLSDWTLPQNREKRAAMLKMVRLYMRLVNEETYKELFVHLKNLVDHVENGADKDFLIPSSLEELTLLLDDITDVKYVLNGLANCFSLPLGEGWKEVQRSNMAKVMPDGRVLRRPDGKILKPEGWQEPQLSAIIDYYLRQEERQKEPWQAKLSNAILTMQTKSRQTEHLDMAIKNKEIQPLLEFAQEMTAAIGAINNALSEMNGEIK